jgi:hypothetical protein
MLTKTKMEEQWMIGGEDAGSRVVGLAEGRAQEEEAGRLRQSERKWTMSAEMQRANGEVVGRVVKERIRWWMWDSNLLSRIAIRQMIWQLKCPRRIVHLHFNDFDKDPKPDRSDYQRIRRSHEIGISNLYSQMVLGILDPQVLLRSFRQQ